MAMILPLPLIVFLAICLCSCLHDDRDQMFSTLDSKMTFGLLWKYSPVEVMGSNLLSLGLKRSCTLMLMILESGHHQEHKPGPGGWKTMCNRDKSFQLQLIQSCSLQSTNLRYEWTRQRSALPRSLELPQDSINSKITNRYCLNHWIWGKFVMQY